MNTQLISSTSSKPFSTSTTGIIAFSPEVSLLCCKLFPVGLTSLAHPQLIIKNRWKKTSTTKPTTTVTSNVSTTTLAIIESVNIPAEIIVLDNYPGSDSVISGEKVHLYELTRSSNCSTTGTLQGSSVEQFNLGDLLWCGGLDTSLTNYSSQCNFGNESWPMNSSRAFASSVKIGNDSVLIAGGESESQVSRTTEIVTIGKSFPGTVTIPRLNFHIKCLKRVVFKIMDYFNKA